MAAEEFLHGSTVYLWTVAETHQNGTELGSEQRVRVELGRQLPRN